MSGSAGMGVSGSVEREKAVRGGKRSKRVRSERKVGMIRVLYGCSFMTGLRRRCSGHAALLTLLTRSRMTGVAGSWPSFTPLPIPNSITLYHKPVWRQSLSRQGSAGVQNTPPPTRCTHHLRGDAPDIRHKRCLACVRTPTLLYRDRDCALNVVQKNGTTLLPSGEHPFHVSLHPIFAVTALCCDHTSIVMLGGLLLVTKR